MAPKSKKAANQARQRAEAKLRAEERARELAEQEERELELEEQEVETEFETEVETVVEQPEFVEEEWPRPKPVKKRGTRNSEDAGDSVLTFTPAQRVKVQTKALPPVNVESVVTPQTNFFERLQGYSVDEDEREEVPSNFNQFTSTPQFPGNWAETTQNFEFESEPPSPVENLQTYTTPETPYFSPSRLHSHLRREGDLWKGPSESPLTPLPDSEDEV